MRAILLGLFMSLFACSTLTAPSHPAYSLALGGPERLAAMTVALVEETAFGGLRPYCSGVWVGENLIMTAEHCVHRKVSGDSISYVVRGDVYEPGAYAEREDIQARKATLYLVEESHDIALIRTAPPPPHPIAVMHQGPIYQGDATQTMGQSLGLWYSYGAGVVAALRVGSFGTEDSMLWVQSTAPVSPGNSGGALFDSEGHILGICHGSFTRGQGLNLFVHVQYAAALLAKAV